MNKISGYAKLQKDSLIKVVLFCKKSDVKITTMKYIFGKPYQGIRIELKGGNLKNTISFISDSKSSGRLSNDIETLKASESPNSKKTTDVSRFNQTSSIESENWCLN